jgi:hypothetical protein
MSFLSVCRKQQGIPWSPEQPKGLAVNSAHLVDVSVRAEPYPTGELSRDHQHGQGVQLQT